MANITVEVIVPVLTALLGRLKEDSLRLVKDDFGDLCPLDGPPVTKLNDMYLMHLWRNSSSTGVHRTLS